ncbi:MAG: hypothetical protein HY585_05455 [Candidatus Omnitrophica bacterium]|nr:hypothetical protein [Candidatus Omnitrophota bacterium]
MRYRWSWEKIPAIFVGFVIVLSIYLPVAVAAVSITNQSGTITITSPGGDVVTVEQGQALPSIASGSTIEVVTGSANISASEGDSANVLINGATAVVQEGAEVKVLVDLKTGDADLEVVSGDIQITQPDGTIKTLTVGDSASVVAPAPLSVSNLGTPGTDASGNVGRQEDVEQGLVGGY